MLLQVSVGSHEKSRTPLTTVAASVRQMRLTRGRAGERSRGRRQRPRARPCPITSRHTDETGFLWANRRRRRRQKRIRKFLNGRRKIDEYYCTQHQRQRYNMNSWWYDSMLHCDVCIMSSFCLLFICSALRKEVAMFGLHATIIMVRLKPHFVMEAAILHRKSERGLEKNCYLAHDARVRNLPQHKVLVYHHRRYPKSGLYIGPNYYNAKYF